MLGALRSLTGRALGRGVRARRRAGEAARAATLGEEELLERLKRDFGAEEVFDDDEPESED